MGVLSLRIVAGKKFFGTTELIGPLCLSHTLLALSLGIPIFSLSEEVGGGRGGGLCLLGNSDFHSLMAFTSKKMPNNIFKIFVKSFSIG